MPSKAQVARYSEKALPPLPLTPLRTIIVEKENNMTFGVLNTGPKRFTLTNSDAFKLPGEMGKPQKKMVQLNAETPLQSPQPQSPRNKLHQLTGYDLGISNHDGPASPKKIGRISSGDSISSMSSEGSSSVYSQRDAEIDSAISKTSEWGNWTPVDYTAPSKLNQKQSFSQQPDVSITFTPQSEARRMYEVPPLSLRTKDRPQTPQTSKAPAFVIGKPEPSVREPVKTADVEAKPVRTWRQFSFDDGYDEAAPQTIHQVQEQPSESFLRNSNQQPAQLAKVAYDSTIRMATPLDPSNYDLSFNRSTYSPTPPQIDPLLLPPLPISKLIDRQEADNVSQWSNSSEESHGLVSNARDSVISSIHAIASPFKHSNRPTSIFRDKKYKPSSIRVPSPTPTTSTRRSNFSSGNHPLKSPFPFNTYSPDLYANEHDLDEEGEEDENDNETFAHRLSAAFRSLSSKATSPTSPSSSNFPIIKSRIIHTSARKKNGPDTPFPTKFSRRNSYGEKLKHISEDVKENVVESGKKVLRKGKVVFKGVGEVVGEMKGSKTNYELVSDRDRRERLMRSIRVVRDEEDENVGNTTVGGVKVESLQQARERMDLWV